MQRSLTHSGVPETVVAAPIHVTGADVWRRIAPLWRHAVWVSALFAVLSAAASVRLDVQQMRKELDRNARHTREARILNDRLRLEQDARRRAVAMEGIAAQLQLGPQASVVSSEAITP